MQWVYHSLHERRGIVGARTWMKVEVGRPRVMTLCARFTGSPFIVTGPSPNSRLLPPFIVTGSPWVYGPTLRFKNTYLLEVRGAAGAGAGEDWFIVTAPARQGMTWIIRGATIEPRQLPKMPDDANRQNVRGQQAYQTPTFVRIKSCIWPPNFS